MTALPMRKNAPQHNALEVLTPLPLFGLRVGDILQVTPKDSYCKGEIVMMTPVGRHHRYVCAYLFCRDKQIALLIPHEHHLQLLTVPTSEITIIGSVVNCQKLRVGLFA